MDTDQKNSQHHLDGFSRHLRILRGLRDSSVNAYLGMMREFFSWRAGNAHDGPFDTITRQEIEQYIEWCYYRGNRDMRIRTKLVALQNFFRYLVYSGVISQDPTTDIPRARIRQKLMPRYHKPDVLKIFAQIDLSTEKGIRDNAIFILSALGGLRAGEICRLNIQDIEDEAGQIDLRIVGTKHQGDRVVWMWKAPSLFLRQMLMARLSAGARPQDPLIVSYWRNGKPRAKARRITSGAVDRLVKQYAAAAGLRKAQHKSHMFRAGHIDALMTVRGFELPAIAERVGHKSIGTTEKYLGHRGRTHRVYNDLHTCYSELTKIWMHRGKTNADNGGDDVPAEE